MKKAILAAVVIVAILFVAFGYLLYKTGENMTKMHRCGCHERDY